MKKYDDCIRDDGDCRICSVSSYTLDCHGERVHFDGPEQYRETVDNMETMIIEGLGEAGALEAISKALSYDVKEDVYAYIIRCYDLEGVSE